MAFEVISTDITATYNIDANDLVYLKQGASVLTSGNSFSAQHDGVMSLSIQGEVASATTALTLGVTATDTSDMIVSIGETGSVSSLRGATAIFIRRDGADIVNNGEITSDYRGVYFYTGATSGSLRNTGLITTNSNAALIADGNFNALSGTFAIENSGTIMGGTEGIYILYQSADIQNYGTITGEIAVKTNSNSASSNALNLNNMGDLFGRSGDAVVSGNAGDTVLNSGRIVGDVKLNAGNDTFDGRGGVVQGSVHGGLGDDLYIVDDSAISLTELAAQGTDTVRAATSWTLGDNFENLDLTGAGNIRGIGNGLANTITGNAGDNRLNGKGDKDTLSGGDGDDLIFGGAGRDTLNGDDGDDILRGGKSRDKLNGGTGNDVLYGGQADDRMFGDDGNDVLIGGLGADVMTGGNGKDVFVFNRKADSLRGSPSDSITDFVIGEDRIDLSGLHPTLSYIGSGAFSGAAGEVQVTLQGGGSLIKIDVDGDSSWDMKIVLDAVTGVSAADFIL